MLFVCYLTWLTFPAFILFPLSDLDRFLALQQSLGAQGFFRIEVGVGGNFSTNMPVVGSTSLYHEMGDRDLCMEGLTKRIKICEKGVVATQEFFKAPSSSSATSSSSLSSAATLPSDSAAFSSESSSFSSSSQSSVYPCIVFALVSRISKLIP